MRLAALSLMTAIAILPGVASCADPNDAPVKYAKDDHDMNLAMDEARSTLPLFWRWVESQPAADAYLVKARFDNPGGYPAHMWVAHLRRDGNKVNGVLASNPGGIDGLSLGDPVSFDAGRISDWLIQGDCDHGGFTQRVMVKTLPPAEAAELAASLCPNPLPSEP